MPDEMEDVRRVRHGRWMRVAVCTLCLCAIVVQYTTVCKHDTSYKKLCRTCTWCQTAYPNTKPRPFTSYLAPIYRAVIRHLGL